MNYVDTLQLLNRCQAGNSLAIEALVRTFTPPVYRLAEAMRLRWKKYTPGRLIRSAGRRVQPGQWPASDQAGWARDPVTGNHWG